MKTFTEDDKDFIVNLSHEMQTQDTRCTAQPYALILREEEKRLVPSGYSDKVEAFWKDEEYKDWDDFIIALKEYYEYGEEAFNDYSVTKELLCIFEMSCFNDLIDTHEEEAIECNCQYVSINMEVKEHNANFFLTEKAYHEHIARNGHNLNKPDSYGIHLHRNSEMEKLYDIIHKLAKELKSEK